jgi:hypothetical protein
MPLALHLHNRDKTMKILAELLQLLENKTSKNMTRAEKDAKRAAKKAETDAVLQNASDRLKAEKQAKMDAMYDGSPVKIKLKVWTDRNLKTGKQNSEMREFTVDNKLEILRLLSDVELIDMRYLENPKDREETYAIKTGDHKHYTGSIPEYLFDLPKGTRKKKGSSPRDLRREVYDA